MDINDIQEEIISEFSLLDSDMEMTVFYIMELGQKLPVMDDALKTEENVVKGCQSKVWLTANLDDDKIYFSADSNTAITKGLVSLLIRIFNGQSPEAILNANLHFMQKIGMERFIGTQRSNGFAAMIKQMKLYALAFKTKLEVKS
ncbi:cysteine desulfuration protein SufE [Chryseolinea serpens]|uniref:Cysteine desulfuration protein SufE n=1 Tax=Chryseolinea serpens TaxID=947013 RepID=A0A1M5L0M9_9BACT|nr:SufE family protein [Chryseolinea serpens]SHG58598.1 cysteine desulfuration protein SufE [Chryseolinea serpens]